MRNIILASASPRRKKLLKQLGIEFTIDASNIDEKLNPRYRPRKQIESLSLQKAQAVAPNYDDAVIIAADTMVALGDEMLGKPKDKKEAARMLRKLSGTQHVIITAFTVIDSKTKKVVTKSVETKVFFKKLSPKEIRQYIETKEPIDKAGAYAIQEKGALFIEKIEGDYFGAVGLPLFLLGKELKRFDIEIK